MPDPIATDTEEAEAEDTEFLQYSPQDIVAMGQERGADPDAIVNAVNTHRANLEAWGRKNHPDTYWQGSAKLEQDSQAALDALRSQDQTRFLQEHLDPAQLSEFSTELEAAQFDPDKISDSWQPIASELSSIASRYQLPNRQQIHGGKIDVGDTTLARYSLREAADGSMDAHIEFDDGTTGLTSIARATDDDARSEIERERARYDTLIKQAAQAKTQDPWLPVVQTADVIENDAKQSLARLDQLRQGGARYLMGERVTDALKTGPLKDRVGQYALGQDFLKGLINSSLSAGIFVNRFAGSQTDLDELLEAQKDLETVLPGSTKPQFNGSLPGQALSAAANSLGNMAPALAGNIAVRGLATAAELKAIDAGRTGVVGATMGVQSYGQGFAEAEREARASEESGDFAKAARIRAMRDVHALLTAGADTLTERIGTGQITSTWKRAARDIAQEGVVEEGLATTTQDVLINPLTLERQPTLENVPKAMLAGSIAAAPMVGVNAALNRSATPNNAKLAQPASVSTDAPPVELPTTPAAAPQPINIPDDQRARLTKALVNVGIAEHLTDRFVDHVAPYLDLATEDPQTLPAKTLDVLNQLNTRVPNAPDQAAWLDALDAQNTRIDTALAQGPQTMLDVAMRAGQTDTPRLQFSIANRASRLRAQEELANRALTSIVGHGQDGGSVHDRSGGNAPVPAMVSLPAEILRGSEERSFGWSAQRLRELQTRNQVLALHRAGSPQPADHGTILGQGGEHQVFYRDDDPHVTKRTHTGRYGQVLDQTGPSGAFKLNLRPATPAEYLRRIGLQNIVFGDSIRVVGIEQGPEGPVIVTQQPHIKGAHPSIAQVETFLKANGFQAMPETMYDPRTLNETKRPWLRSQDGVVVADAKPENFILSTNQKGQPTLVPIDVVIQILPDDLLDATRNRAQYSLQGFGERLTAKLKAPVKAALEALRLLNQSLPGFVTPKITFFANPEEMLNSTFTQSDGFTPEEIAQMQDAEAFFDNRTGYTIVFLDHVRVRPGESERAAIARVLLHERVGHDGLNQLIERDAKFAEAWRNLTARIPAEELNAIATDYPHLAADPEHLAFEWFARQVERIATAQTGLQGIAKQMWDAIKALYARIFKPFSSSLQTEHDLRQLITAATSAARNGTAIPTTAAGLRLQYSLGGTQLFHTEGQPFRVNELATRTILTGSSLPRAFTEAVQATERERRAIDQVAAQIGRDLDESIRSHSKRTGTDVAQVYDMVHQAMSGAPGTNAVLLQLDPVLSERARVARNFIDDLSIAVANTLPRGPLRNNIVLNQGAWLRRSYAAFDAASGWNFDNVMKAARANQELGGKPARTIVAAAARLLSERNGYPRSMLNAQGLPIEGTPLEADMRDLMDRDIFTNAMTGGAAVRKNVSSLITRQDIPAELRALMGEDTNPIKRLINSTSFQVQFIQRHQQQQALRTIGLNNRLFATDRAGVYTTQIPDNHRWSALSGLWTTPQLWEALQRVDGTERGNDFFAKMGDSIKWLGSEAKLNRVAMNPDSWLVNAAGNVVALAQTGDLFSTTLFSRIAQAIGLMRAGKAKSGDVVDTTVEAITEAKRAMIARLNAAGVLGETFSARDLEASLPRHLLQWVEQDAKGLRDRSMGALKGALYGQAAGRGLGTVGRIGGGLIGATVGAITGHKKILGWQQALADYVMTGPDALARLTGFLGNLETAHAAGLKNQDAFQHAAERTRNTFPDYSRLPAILRNLSKYGLAGSFIAFQYEVYRNAIWNLRYAAQDLRSGNAALTTRGVKRVLGASMVGYLAAGGLQALFQNAAGTDDERNNRWRRWFAAPWEKHAVLAFTDYNDKSVTYFNTSYLVPQTTIAELAQAATDGRSPAEAAGNILAQGWEQFAGSSVHVAPLLQAIMNSDRMGRPISHQTGVKGALERVDYVTKVTMEPAWTAKMERIEYALREAERRGRTFSVQEELERFIGIRKFTRTWPDLVQRRFDGFARDYSAIRSQANATLAEGLPGAQKVAIQTANNKIETLLQELAQFEADLPTLGVPRTTIDTARKDSNLPKLKPFEVDPESKDKVRTVR